MKRTGPLVVCFIFALIMMVQAFVPHPFSEDFLQLSNNHLMVMSTFALAIGISTFVHLHLTKIRKNGDGWYFSIVALVGMVVTAMVGIFGKTEAGTLYDKIFFYVQNPMQSAMFSLLAFFMASAAYRAFRARSFEATLLLLAAIVVMLGRVPIGDLITGGATSKITEFLFSVPNMAAKRAIMLGVSLGVIATSLKIIFGIERSWLGGTD